VRFYTTCPSFRLCNVFVSIGVVHVIQQQEPRVDLMIFPRVIARGTATQTARTEDFAAAEENFASGPTWTFQPYMTTTNLTLSAVRQEA